MTGGEEIVGGIARSIELAWTLLASDHTGIDLREVAPDPAPGDVGARDGFGAVVPDCDVRLSVYAFDEWGGGQRYALAVQSGPDEPGRITRAVMNGSLLLIATGARQDPSEYLLNDICSAFAGAE
jgi:hypothetical protein